MDEIEAGKAAFLSMLAELDPRVQTVIPSRATDDRFLIALSRGGSRVFITVAEDDLIDLEADADVAAEVRGQLEEALEGLGE